MLLLRVLGHIIILVCCLLQLHAYADDIPDLESRAMPTPFDTIFPSMQYPGPIIGAPDDAPISTLTNEMWRSFPSFKNNRIRLYGWVEPSYNASTSSQSNIPLAFDIVPNRVELDQWVMRIERIPDTVQTEHMDWGFQGTNIFGIDYRYTVAQGIFSGQRYIQNNLYGDDPLEFYGVLYFPAVAEGMVLRVGRFGSPADIEDALASYSTFLTHSITMTYDAYTQMGVSAIIRYSKQVTLLASLHGGSDVAVWAAGAHPSGQLVLRWLSKDNNNVVLGSIVSLNNGQFAGDHDNLQQMSLTWTHRFNEGFRLSAEAVYTYQFNAALGGSCEFGPPQPFGGGGGGCGPIIPGLSNSVGLLTILEKKISENQFLAFRFDFFNDPQGQRTRYATPYINLTFGLTHTIRNMLRIRPEIRYDTAFKATPFDNGEKKNQTTFGVDLLLYL